MQHRRFNLIFPLLKPSEILARKPIFMTVKTLPFPHRVLKILAHDTTPKISVIPYIALTFDTRRLGFHRLVGVNEAFFAAFK